MDLDERIGRLEDRAAISETIIRYFNALDMRDWPAMRACLTDVFAVDFSSWRPEMEPLTLPADDFVGFAERVLTGFDVTQHISPNHVLESLERDEATCTSYMYAQHFIAGAEGGEHYLMRGYYTNRMRRTPEGWKLEALTMHLTWADGNDSLHQISEDRFVPAGKG